MPKVIDKRRKGPKQGKARDQSGTYDAVLALGPCSEEFGQSKTVSQHILEKYKKSQNESARHIQRAQRNERFFHNGFSLASDVTSKDDDPDGTRNYFRNMVQTWSSRFGDNRPNIVSYAKHPETGDLQASRAADSIIYYVHQKERLDYKFLLSAQHGQLHGKTALRPYWDPQAGPDIIVDKVHPLSGAPITDENGVQEKDNLGPRGEIRVKNVTIFDYDYGDAEDLEDADWVYFRSFVTAAKARGILYRAHGKYLDVQTEKFFDADGKSRDGVLMLEFFQRRGDELPQGLEAVVVGGHVASVGAFKPESNLLPIAEWRVNPIRGSRFCTSHADDAIPQQKIINLLEQAKLDTIEKVGFPKVLGLGKLTEQYDQDDVAAISCDDVTEVTQGMRFLEPPKPAEMVFREQQEFTAGMHDTFGLNEVLIGKDSVKSGTSAKQIAYMDHQDSQKMALPIRDFETCALRLARLIVEMAKDNIKAERLIDILGPDGQLQLQFLRGSDLEGTFIHMEPNSGMDRFRAQARAEADEDLMQGKASPAEAKERAETGLGDTMGGAAEFKRAQDFVRGLIQGQPFQPDPSLNPMSVLKAIGELHGMAKDPESQQRLMQALQFFKQQMAQNRAPDQAQGKKKQGPPGPNTNRPLADMPRLGNPGNPGNR